MEKVGTESVTNEIDRRGECGLKKVSPPVYVMYLEAMTLEMSSSDLF